MTLSNRILLINAVFWLTIAFIILGFTNHDKQPNINMDNAKHQSRLDEIRTREVAMIKRLYGDD